MSAGDTINLYKAYIQNMGLSQNLKNINIIQILRAKFYQMELKDFNISEVS
jgi:hypothetical protein